MSEALIMPGPAQPHEKTCVFCGGPGPLTREHVIAQWIVSVLEDLEPEHPEWGTHYVAGGLVERNRQHRSPGPTVVVRAVCAACNNGWMADLEARVGSVLEPMIRGRSVTLTVEQQLEVATWASKTAIALESFEPTTAVARPEDRLLLRNEQRPPAHHRVRVAYRNEYLESVMVKFSVARSTTASDERPDTFALTLAIGFLIVQIWGGHGAEIASGLEQGGTKIGRAIMLWPPVASAVTWPPSQPIADDDLDSFAREVLLWTEDSPDVAAWRAMRVDDQ